MFPWRKREADPPTATMTRSVDMVRTERHPLAAEQVDKLPASLVDESEGVIPEKYRTQAMLLRLPETAQSPARWVLVCIPGSSTNEVVMGVGTKLADIKKDKLTRVYLADSIVFKLVQGRFSKQEKQKQSARQPDAHAQHQGHHKTEAILMFESIVAKAIDSRATDIHIATRGTSGAVMFRVDGMIERQKAFDMPADMAVMAMGAAYSSLSNKGTQSEPTFIPSEMQSCMIEHTHNNKMYRLRYQSSPVQDGADFVIRLLPVDLVGKPKSLEFLGYAPSQIKMLDIARRSNGGMIVLSGVTGSGKSTTLQTLMTSGDKHRLKKKMFSIEDPVEYKMFGVSQISVQRSAKSADTADKGAGNPFLAAIRAVLRMDPDTVMVGEIRDAATGSICKSMVLSGHQVMTSVHAPSAITAVTKLASKEIGIPRDDLALRGFLNAVVYQRLVATTCPHCARPAVEVLPEERRYLIHDKLGIDISGVKVVREGGCPKCIGTGILGQTVAAEIFVPTQSTLEAIAEGRDARAEVLWRRERVAALHEPDMHGKTAFEHGMFKMAAGLIDPAILEEAFMPFERYIDELSETI